jgi:hypothetical protein
MDFIHLQKPAVFGRKNWHNGSKMILYRNE